jgi:hypothetical protein
MPQAEAVDPESKQLLYGHQVSRLLLNYHRLQPRSVRHHVRGVQHRAVHSDWGEVQSHSRLLFP